MRTEDVVIYDATLASCPFCGSAEQRVIGASLRGGWLWSARCRQCDARVEAETEESVITKWNRRYVQDEIEDDGYITWKRNRQRYVDELTGRDER